MGNASLKDFKINVKTGDILQDIVMNSGNSPQLRVEVPETFFQTLLSDFLERDYLNYSSQQSFLTKGLKKRSVQWLQIARLPIHPNEHADYNLLSHWKGVLSSLHAWNYRLVFMLQRYNGQTKLYLGAVSFDQGLTNEDAIEQVREAAFGSMPGMEMRILDAEKGDVYDEIAVPLSEMDHVGAVTGIPSFADEDDKKALEQTLDQLAFGIRDIYGEEKDYALIVIADPIPDNEIAEIISAYRTLGSQIHSSVSFSTNESRTRGEDREIAPVKKAAVNVATPSIGGILGGIIGTFVMPGIGTMIGSTLGSGVGSVVGKAVTSSLGGRESASSSAGITRNHLDKFAEFAEHVTDHHVERLNEGRNLGFWNTGVYVLGQSDKDIKTVTGILRSVYSGKESYYEPIRLHTFNRDSGALNIVKRFELLHIPDTDTTVPDRPNERVSTKLFNRSWHLLGNRFEYISTPINTTELALTTSLPRRDVPGLRFVKTAVRFANNPAPIHGDNITIGNIVDTGVVQNTRYDIDVNSLVRHALVAGSTGSGKSTTCKRILHEVMRRDIPILVIEPAKDDYVRWAIEQNKTLPDEKKFRIFMPGIDNIDGYPVEQLYINPFQPAAVKGAKVDLLQHSENFATLLNAALPGEEVIPILMEEVVYTSIFRFAMANGRDIRNGLVEPMRHYPNVDIMVREAVNIMKNKTYDERNKTNLSEILITRLQSLRRGTRGKILNVKCSTDYDRLFSQNVIINLSRLSGSKDKALVMSLLMQALYDYRQSCYNDDMDYREKARQNKLCHLTLVEEAHNVLLKPVEYSSSGSPQRAAADLFDNLLSEIRSYGEGFIVVDQVPTRLIDGAIKNTNYKIVHRLTAPDDQDVMASCMAFREDQKYIIPALEKGNAIICGDEDDAAVWVKIPAPGKDVR